MKIISTNPSKNYEVIGEVEVTTNTQVDDAITSARTAQPAWAAYTQDQRNQAVRSLVTLFEEQADEISAIVSKEMGMPITRSRSQVKTACSYLMAFVDMAESALAPEVVFENATERHLQTREPLGVVAYITPWNFPLLNVPWQAGQALLAGNAVLYKPSEETILFAKLIQDLINESELPSGVFTVILGDGKTGEYLASQPVDAILFTGSTATGQRITEIAAKNSTQVLTEMGGSAAGIVFEDADVLKIIDTLYAMRFYNSGQLCDGLKRLLVHKSKLDEVFAALKQVNAVTKVGDAMEESTTIGPLAAKRQLELLEAQMQDATEQGASVLFGGREPDNLQGAYYEPTALTNINQNMRIWNEEVFGPVLPIMTFKDEAEAIKLANDTPYGLAGFVFTEDVARYRRVAKLLETGVVAHNNALFYSPQSPFGGYKASGNSRTCGVAGFHEVSQIKLINEEK